MRTRRTSLALATVAAAVAAVAAGCGGGGTSREDFEADVRETRDRVDTALASITKASSKEDLLNRMEDASAVVSVAADELDRERAPDEFDDEKDALVARLYELSSELEATSTDIQRPEFESIVGAAGGFSFESWDATNEVLQQLRQQGIDVQPLARH